MTDDQIERLIIEVEAHPYLYDKSNKFYKNKHLREEFWTATSEAIGVDC